MTLAAVQIHAILANERRRRAIDQLVATRTPLSASELATYVAEEESGESPPPKALRESVYGSLVQTHLPTLQSAGVITYDLECKMVSLTPQARNIRIYQELVGPAGVTWADWYRVCGLVGLLIILGSLLSVPIVAAVDPILWTSAALFTFAALSASHLWSYRFSIPLWFPRR
ncbi:DUF7344 domain-containing protein [Halalkalirubrum salinum]|uniref:DUF7344 domain-containing protein n=1 Tax=Halalkalirubrum salinum TaxID=2563889 RepID=UPI0010FBAC03|nr:hypothetical protein [Halalkalirubrum salinum]